LDYTEQKNLANLRTHYRKNLPKTENLDSNLTIIMKNKQNKLKIQKTTTHSIMLKIYLKK